MPRVPTADEDDMLLLMVRARHAGVTGPEVAARLGVRRQFVTDATNAVLKADLNHPDPSASKDCIAGYYW